MAGIAAKLAFASLSLSAISCWAQDATPEDLTQPPRIDDQAQVERQVSAAGNSPGETRLEPAEEEREDVLEAVVTGGQTDFRLPDLGTSFRNAEEERDPNQRMEVTFLYLYDPENIDPAEEVFPTIEDLRRVGFLRVFELRFGRRSRE
jgi:hypothetical protein